MPDDLSPFDAARANRIVQTILAAFEAHHIQLRDSPLKRDLSEIEWLASRGDRMAGSPSDATERDRVIRAWLTAIRMDAVARALNQVSRVQGIDQVLRRIRSSSTAEPRKPHDLSQARREAWDRFFEIEIASRLVSLPGLSFAEPDLVLTDENASRFGVACKRPAKWNAVLTAVGRAREQIEASACGVGVVAIGLDIERTPFIIDTNRASALARCQGEVESCARKLTPDIVPVLNAGDSRGARTLGVVLFQRFNVILKGYAAGGAAFLPRPHFTYIPNPFHSHAPDELEALIHALSTSEPRH